MIMIYILIYKHEDIFFVRASAKQTVSVLRIRILEILAGKVGTHLRETSDLDLDYIFTYLVLNDLKPLLTSIWRWDH